LTNETKKYIIINIRYKTKNKILKEIKKMKTIKELRIAIENEKGTSAWTRAVKEYALELIENENEDFEFFGSPADKKMLLNGADSWLQYSEGGCSLIYDYDIAKRVCTASKFKKTKEGENNPNSRENWIECQARALFQAERMILRLARS
jgi:hypothetical protein